MSYAHPSFFIMLKHAGKPSNDASRVVGGTGWDVPSLSRPRFLQPPLVHSLASAGSTSPIYTSSNYSVHVLYFTAYAHVASYITQTVESRSRFVTKSAATR